MASDEQILQGLRDIFASPLGVDAIYTPFGGVPLADPIRVILERSVLLQPSDMNAQVPDRADTIEAMLEDVSEEPNRGATFAIGTETFTVQAIDKNDGDTVLMVVK